MENCRGNTLESHRLIYFAGKQGHDKQHKLVEELYNGYFSQGKYIGDRLDLDQPNFFSLCVCVCVKFLHYGYGIIRDLRMMMYLSYIA